MSKKTRKHEPSIDEIIAFLDRVLPKSKGEGRDSFFMPGIDAYTPSYASNGVDQWRPNGQLEPDSQRNQHQHQ